MFEPYQLEQRQSLPLESKIRLAMMRIRTWYLHWEGEKIAVVNNGSMASRVLVHLSRDMDPLVPVIDPLMKNFYHPIVPFLVGDDSDKKSEWLKHGCNALTLERPQCRPLSVWLDDDVDQYIAKVMNERTS